jgi:hypothetical protein
VTLAAQGLGGAAVWVDSTDAREGDGAGDARETSTESISPTVSRARFGFARDEAALGELRARIGISGPWALGLFTAEHGSPQEGPAAALRGYADAVAGDGGPRQPPPSRARPSDAAVHVLGRAQSLTHAALVAAARAWLEANEIGAGHRAFTWEAPTTEAAAIFIASWLAGGLSLTLPEDAATADADRREDQPTIVAATAAAYERLWQQIADNLPAPGTWLRRAVDAGLVSAAGQRIRRAFGAWIVRRPLRKVIGFGRAELAVVLDAAPPSPAAQASFARLGVPLRALSPGSSPEVAGAAARFSPPAADHAPLFEARLAAGKLT